MTWVFNFVEEEYYGESGAGISVLDKLNQIGKSSKVFSSLLLQC